MRLYTTGLGFQASIVEEGVLLSALLYIFVGLKRTWDRQAVYGIDGRSTEFGYHWFDVAHVHQLVAKLVDCVDFFFWADDMIVPEVPVRDIFLNEYKVLKKPKMVLVPHHGRPHLHDVCVPRMETACIGTVIRNPKQASVLCQVLRAPSP